VDQDERTLEEIGLRFNRSHINPRNASIRTLFSRKALVDSYCGVYVTGLYDYLNDQIAKRLTKILFNKLRPGGTLLVANFHKSMPDAGFMDTLMDWNLIYRDEEDMLSLCADIPHIGEREMYLDHTGCVVFLELRKPS
jgi:hypothetical protein